MYRIVIDRRAQDEVARLPAHARARLATYIARELTYEPMRTTAHKKRLRPLKVPWSRQAEQPWQLAVEPYRVFYDVDETDKVVFVRLVRRKPPGKKTEEIR
ncbi:MAG: type II toxin-antitoxin system RelE/ParE family toxin [Deltaproteobacteria bacterium]|nr:type II toxin-antitoxin system RelE/ParE family toxin [Deltaproteobacteria bacterium]